MKCNGYVVQTNSVSLDRLVQYQAEGILGRVYVQVHHNSPDIIERNHAVFPAWKAALPGKVFAWLWGTDDVVADRERLLALDEKLDPDGWMHNDEIPTFHADRSAVYEAGSGKPQVLGPIGFPPVSPGDFRHADRYGLTVDWQAYDENGINDKDPEYLVNELFQISKVIVSEGGSSWWYRVFFDNLLSSKGKIVQRWAWVQAVRVEGDWIALREGRNTWWTRGANRDGFGWYLVDRVVINRNNQRKVGRVFGLARYPNIAVTLSTERPYSPEGLASLAVGARVAGAARRPITFYTLDNTSDAAFRAVASL